MTVIHNDNTFKIHSQFKRVTRFAIKLSGHVEAGARLELAWVT
ncbi:hypothetical protein SEA_GODONK_151 [Gordonia phage GodonK]|uniref:Uncharacterized protein n=1 Tax=Gordonia phage GodonK TaxID=2562192 RepID=A0A4D6E2L6_9CAUD|nr:hypothetical protein HOV33_gp205 [Gordonia phage GodonK]QBZ72751.1 hypothetical protein SEA_GODONK_151 [Gordonia phage GodonK]